jgi:hypothetical protein
MCGHAKRHGWSDLEAAVQEVRAEARAHARAGQRMAASVAGGGWTAAGGSRSGSGWGSGPSPAPDPEPDPNLLIGDREREGVIDALKQATADGRLTIDEFSDRVEETYAARTIADLRHVLRQLPENVRAAAEPPRPAAPAPAPVVYRHHRRGMHPAMVMLLVALAVVVLSGGQVFILLPFFWLIFVFRRFGPRRS